MTRRSHALMPVFTLAVAGLALVSGCDRQANTYEPPPPPQVTIAPPLRQAVTDYATFTGTITAVGTVDVRARIKGFLQSMNFTPGEAVRKDQVLFVIEPAPYQAALDQAKADLARDQAKLQLAEIELKRTNELAQEQAATPLEVLQRTADRDSSAAQVAADQAAVQEAQLDLGYTQVRSPIDGRVSRNYVDVGNLVGDGEATLLTTVVSQDPIYVYFTVSELEYLRCRKQLGAAAPSTSPDTMSASSSSSVPAASATAAAPAPAPGTVELALASEVGFPHRGQVDFTDVKVDSATGTIELRGIFPNPQARLLPGMFCRVRIPVDQEDSLLVPDEAVGVDQAGDYLLVVNDQGEVEHRMIQPGPLWRSMRVVRGGITAEDWVIVNGLQRVRPGMKVNASKMTLTVPEATTPAATTPAATLSTSGAKPQAAEGAKPQAAEGAKPQAGTEAQPSSGPADPPSSPTSKPK